jgi:hypothetical protein
MIGQHDKRFSLPGDVVRHAIPGSSGGAEGGSDDPPSRPTRVTCPNPDCAMELTVPDRAAGKESTCPGCGATVSPGSYCAAAAVPLPAPHVPSTPRRSGRAASERNPQEIQPGVARSIPTVRTGCIGRGNAGKTALFRALSDGPVGDFLPSGLHVDAGDPREVARLIRESEQTQRMLHSTGLPATLIASQIRYCLYEGAEPCATYQLQEVIGQLLTHTLPDSAAAQQARYDEYLANLVNTQVLWAVVPCLPAEPGPRGRRRYANDLRITLAYLREALRRRSPEQPVAVALVLSKIDTLFPNSREARAALTEEVLERSLGPLVDLLRTSERVSEASIIPVTAFGFGNAMIKEPSGLREAAPPDAEDEPFGTEPLWILCEGVEPVPFNLDALFLWTLLFGLRSEETTGAGDQDRQTRRISDRLQNDLESANPWIIPIK